MRLRRPVNCFEKTWLSHWCPQQAFLLTYPLEFCYLRFHAESLCTTWSINSAARKSTFFGPSFLLRNNPETCVRKTFDDAYLSKFGIAAHSSSVSTLTLQDDHAINAIENEHAFEDIDCESDCKQWTDIQNQLDGANVKVDSATFASHLRQCGNEQTLSEGMSTHDHIIQLKFEGDRLIRNLLVQMYGKCGALEEARCLFASMQERDVFAWTFMITTNTRSGDRKEAMCLFQRMQQEALIPNSFTLVIILSAYSKESLLAEGKRIDACIAGNQTETNGVLGNSLINMYAKCSSLDDACKKFNQMHTRDVVSWNVMLTAYIQHGMAKMALQNFQHMLLEGFIPNAVTLITIIDACADQAALSDGRRIHTQAIGCRMDLDVGIGNAIVHLYAKCGSPQDALRMFHNMPERNVVSWTSLIAAYAQHGLVREAILLLQQMQLEGVLPNSVTFVNVVSACPSNEAALLKGKELHTYIVAGGLEEDVMLGNALVNMYGKCGNLNGAKRAFDDMPEWDKISWNTLIAAYAHHGHGKEALQFFQQMQIDGMIPDRATLLSILEACTKDLALDEGTKIHACVRSFGLELDFVVACAIINMYGKCGSLDNAQEVFNNLPEKSVILWTAIMATYAQHGQHSKVLKLFQQMQLEGILPDEFTFASTLSACFEQDHLAKGKWMHAIIVGIAVESDVVVSNALASMYGKCGSLGDAHRVFDKTQQKNVVTWTAMITAYAQHGQGHKALVLFRHMQLDGATPNKVTFVSVLDACADQAALEEGSQIHQLLLGSELEPDVILETAVLNMYGKGGCMEDAQCIFDKMLNRNLASWNSIISAYCQHGKGKMALRLFQQMQVEGMSPDEVTFLAILAKCSHTGLVDEACHFFVSMSHDHGLILTMEHYNCMIDLLGRAGRLDEGEKVLKTLPFEATATSWMSFLNACRMHLDVQRAEHAAMHISGLQTDSNASSVLLSNIYAAVDRWEDAAKMRN